MKGTIQANLERYSMPSAGIYDVLAGWLFRKRYREIAEAIAAETPAGSDVLDISCGPGEVLVQLARLSPTLRTTGLDVDAGMIARAERKAARLRGKRPDGQPARPRFVVADVAAMPFPDASFDLVVTSYAVHHWPDRDAGLAEALRVLRPGGRAIIWDLAAPAGQAVSHGEAPATADPHASRHGHGAPPGHGAPRVHVVSAGDAAAGGHDASGAPARGVLGTLRMMLSFSRIPAARHDFTKPAA